MAGNVLEEVLRIVLETKGQEGLDALRKALGEVGDASDETVSETGKLITKLADLNAEAGKASRLQQMAGDIAQTGDAMDTAQRTAYQLALQLGELSQRGEALQADHAAARKEVERLAAAMKEEGANTKELGAAHKAAQAEVKRLGAELKENGQAIKEVGNAQKVARAEMEKLDGVYGKQAAALDKLDKELADAGRDTKDLAKLQDTLGAEVAGATAAIEQHARAVQTDASAAAALKQRLADSDEAFRKFAQSGTASADALKRYRESTDGAAAGSKNLADQGGRLTSMFSGLRSLIAPVLTYLSFDTAIRGVKNLASVGAAAEDAKRSLQNLYGGVEQGNRAYENLRDMAKQSGLAFADLVDDAKKLKAFGLDPLNGSLQALIDQNAAVGGSQQDLSGKVLALGQAWAKQKLQGEEILQLVERGVPVMDTLQKVTGKTAAEISDLSKKGALGRDVIKALYEEIGRANAGAAERGMSSLSGLLSQATARWQEFKDKVANSGVTDYLKQQIGSLLESTRNLDALAKKTADAIITVFNTVKSGAIFIAGHVTEIKALIAAYAAFKITGAIAQLNQWRIALLASSAATKVAAAEMAASGVAATRFAGILKAIPATALVTVGLLGIEWAISNSEKLAKKLAEITGEQAKFDAAAEGSRRKLYEVAKGYWDQAAAMGDYAATTVIAKEKVAALSKEERKGYAERLEGLKQYLLKLELGYQAMDAAGALTKEQAKDWEQVRARLDEVAVASGGVASATAAAADAQAAASKAIADSAKKAVQQYLDMRDSGMRAAAAIDGAFADIKFATPEGAQAAIEIFGKISARGKEVATVVRDELSYVLTKVATHELPALKLEAEKAMSAGKIGAKEFAAAVDAAFKSANFTKLGVDIGAIKTGFTEAGRSAVEAFKGAVKQVGDLGLTVEQKSKAIAQAFDSAFKQASTKAELEALKAAIQAAMASGNIGFQEFQARIAETDGKLAALNNTAAGLGKGAQAGAAEAGAALGSVSAAADKTAASLDKTKKETEKTGEASKQSASATQGFALAIGNVNDKATQAYKALNKWAVLNQDVWRKGMNGLTAEIQRQNAQLQAQVDIVEKQLAQYDPQLARLEQLRAQYRYLADDELRRLINAEEELAEVRARADADMKAQYEAQQKLYADINAAGAAAGGSASSTAVVAAASSLTKRSTAVATASADAAQSIADSTSTAVKAIATAAQTVASSEVTLRVVTEQAAGTPIVISSQQLYEIASAVVRLINQSKSSST